MASGGGGDAGVRPDGVGGWGGGVEGVSDGRIELGGGLEWVETTLRSEIPMVSSYRVGARARPVPR